MKTIKMNSFFLARHQFIPRSSQGFTLIELMIAMAISAVLMAAIFSVHNAQQKTYTAQQQVAEMQQNLRAALWIMTGELRMAGYDQSGSAKDSSCNIGATGTSIAPGIASLNAGRIDFSMDLNGDNDCADERENLSYYVSTVDGIPSIIRIDYSIDTDEDIDNVIAENFDEIRFRYLNSAKMEATKVEDISSIQLSVLARSGEVDRHFANNMKYIPASDNDEKYQWGPYEDNYRRRLMITNITCRNLKI